MYLHIGSGKNLRKSSIIGIFDADRTTTSAVTRKYLSQSSKEARVEAVGDEIPKSFILCRGERAGEFKIYLSQLSTAALMGRMEEKLEEIFN